MSLELGIGDGSKMLHYEALNYVKEYIMALLA